MELSNLALDNGLDSRAMLIKLDKSVASLLVQLDFSQRSKHCTIKKYDLNTSGPGGVGSFIIYPACCTAQEAKCDMSPPTSKVPHQVILVGLGRDVADIHIGIGRVGAVNGPPVGCGHDLILYHDECRII